VCVCVCVCVCVRVCVCVWIRRHSFIAFVMDGSAMSKDGQGGGDLQRKRPRSPSPDKCIRQGKGMSAPKNKRPRSPSPDTASALSKTTLSLEQLGFATYSEIQSICEDAGLNATESARVKHATWIKTWGSRLGSNNLYGW
jgi:hypothetical protein